MLQHPMPVPSPLAQLHQQGCLVRIELTDSLNAVESSLHLLVCDEQAQHSCVHPEAQCDSFQQLQTLSYVQQLQKENLTEEAG